MRTNDTADRPPVGRFLALFAAMLAIAIGLAWLSQDEHARDDVAARHVDLRVAVHVDAAAAGARSRD